jgi:phosphate transport system substrate-binding protein
VMRSTTRLGAAVLGATLLTTAAVGSALAQELEGSVVVSGSSTVRPITDLVAEGFAAANPNVTVSVDGPGSTVGFELLCNGDIDIGDASRAIKDTELETCNGAGISPVELNVGIDGLAVITSTQNDALECLNFNDLYAIFGIESDDLRTWEDIAAFAGELGSTTSAWPSGDIAITAPGDESGTWGSFIEITLQGIQDARAEAGNEAAAETDADGKIVRRTRLPGDIYVASGDDNAIIEGVGGNPNGIGFVGFAYAINNADRVRMIPIDGGDGCVEPDHDTVASGTYPIARPLFIYPDTGRLDANGERYNAAVKPFVDYYLSDEGIANVEGAGYVALAPEALEETRSAWAAASGS